MSKTGTRLDPSQPDILDSPLFAYGTLQIDSVLHTLLGRVPSKSAAQLVGWRAVRLPERPYPGLVPQSNHIAAGHLLTGLSPAEWALLDRFEDPDYDLLQVEVDGQTASAYAWRKNFLDLDWNLERFVEDELPAYVERCATWLARDRAAAATT
ncbi:gamma-glutamylcyclotransferase family protein [Nocardia fusca]|uniref:Putative gamma-glutamylcyclotransferase n=1 Tax=Nocardia fusca TaxID=941183 RepID=A0ABV3F8T4_9NOCA